MDGQCLLPNTVLPSKFDRLNFDGLAGKRQNRQNFLLYGISAMSVCVMHASACVYACVCTCVCIYVHVYRVFLRKTQLHVRYQMK